MQGYKYKYGDTPLAGYTIERAAGRGGFGEVYYAVSDAGRQVALKVLNAFEETELRGISHVMNLKSPHLISVFDVKYSEQGKPFIIMEYVAGPSLRDMIDQLPGGLGEQKSAFFLREIAKGLTYLHEHSIVHRDLKPGNIFYEDGYVKIGDYGLSKAMGAGVNSNQTITVGTVHYMAPEIGAGKYDRNIDIYALGVLLYEMLTGIVPYVGASPGEVLIKHVSGEPDVSGISEPFARVIKKAMAKDPNDRYQSVQEMVEDVFGVEHIQNSVEAFRCEDLSMISEQIAKKVQRQVNKNQTSSQKEQVTQNERIKDNQVVATVPGFLRFIWALAFAMFISIGIALLVSGSSSNGKPFVASISIGITLMFVSLWALRRVFTFKFYGLYGYLGKPFVLSICLLFVLFPMVDLSNNHMTDKSLGINIGFLVFSGILFLVTLFLPSRFVDGERSVPRPRGNNMARKLKGSFRNVFPKQSNNPRNIYSSYNRTVTLLLACLFFIPIPFIGGVHRLYVGKIWTGILWLFTGGIFGIGQVIDIVLIATGHFTDKHDKRVKDWNTDNIMEAFVNDIDRNFKETEKEFKGGVTEIEASMRKELTGFKNDMSRTFQMGANALPSKSKSVSDDAKVNMPHLNSRYGSFYETSDHASRWLAGVLGYVLILVALIFFFIGSSYLPTTIAMGAPDSKVSQLFTQLFSTPEWHRLTENIAQLIGVVNGLFAIVLIMVSRRGNGIRAFLTVLFSFAGFIFGTVMITEAASKGWRHGDTSFLDGVGIQGISFVSLFDKWFTTVIKGAGSEYLVVGALVFSISFIFLLAVNPGRNKRTISIQSQGGNQ